MKVTEPFLETTMKEIPAQSSQKPDHIVAITAIISTAIVLLMCIGGCTTGIIILALNSK